MSTQRPTTTPKKPPPFRWLAILIGLGFVTTLYVTTPGGVLDKVDMIGYAVCHRITARSFIIAGRQLPLCARCTGTFIGALVGLFGQAVVLRRWRAAEFPPLRTLILLIGFMALWAADGLNSYMTLIGGPHLYESHNWLRLTTGALQGLTMSALLYPIFNFTLWKHPVLEPAIDGWRDLGILVILEIGLVVLVLTRWSFLLYPLALLGVAGVLVLLTAVNTMLVLMLVRRDNTADTWGDALGPLLIGLTVSLMLIAAIDVLRYTLTGTWTGIPPVGG